MSEEKPLMIVGGQYAMEKEIGKGSFATVYKGYRTDDKSYHIAIKAVSRSKLKNKKLLENLEIEIAILKKIKHPHIVGLMDCERTATDFYLVMEYCALGDLTFLIRRRKELMENHPLLATVFEKYPPPSEHHNGLHRAFVINYLQQLASSLKFLRSKNLVHRDIKPQNLLLATPLVGYNDSKSFHELGYVGIYNLPILKIADFGFARFLPNTSLAETLCGSPLYMAPEILNYQKYNAKADLWSVGTVLYEMACGKPPFKASNHLELFKKIKRANDTIIFASQCEVEPALRELICSLLTFDPNSRIGFAEFFDNELVNEDLSHYEIDEDIPELENKSKDVIESNMFISEYLTKPSKKDGYPPNLIMNTAPKSLTTVKSENEQNSPKNNINDNETELLTGAKEGPYQSQALKRNLSTEKSKKIDSGSDSMLEKEYVFIEKKSVEVNALADEFAQAGTNSVVQQHQQQLQSQPNIPKQNSNSTRTVASTNNNGNNVGQQNQPQQPQQQAQFLRNRNARSSSGSGSYRRPSLVDRRLSITSLNPSNALSRALGIASTRLFGGGSSNEQQQQSSNSSSPNYKSSLLNPKVFQDLTENIILRVEHLQEQQPSKLDNNSIIQVLETLSAKAFVIFSYAEVKFSQVVPLAPSLEKRLSNGSCAIEEEEEESDFLIKQNAARKRDSSGCSQHSFTSSDLPVYEMRQLSTEAVILYVKSLSILAKAMQITSTWWYESQEKIFSLRLNLLVQWIREKFNECLEKADFLRLKLSELNKTGSINRTYSPETRAGVLNKDGKIENFNAASHTFDEDESVTDETVHLEKILYDRALEISKTAAQLEIQGEHLSNCELAYATSLWMLETLLDDTIDDDPYNEVEMVTTGVLDDQDKKIIRKYIDSIANRLKALRQKING